MADVLLLLGFGLIVVGVGLWSVPAACIVAGAGLLCASFALSRRRS